MQAIFGKGLISKWCQLHPKARKCKHMNKFPEMFKKLLLSSLAFGFVFLAYTHYLKKFSLPLIFFQSSSKGNFHPFYPLEEWEFERNKANALKELNHVNASLKEKLSMALELAQQKEYTILYWQPQKEYEEDITFDPEECGRCLITYNKSKVNDFATKALIFSFQEASLKKIPPQRRSDQFYAWLTQESSYVMRNLRQKKLKEFDNFFNLTMSYRMDSDVFWPRILVSKVINVLLESGSGDPQKDVEDLISQKTHLAIWIVSNCRYTLGAEKRMLLSNQLIHAGLSLARRGSCFESRVKDLKIIRKYKFYMSFENGYHCKDYVTEKFYINGLKLGAVPVVWGAERSSYEAIAPPKSFIFAEDFDSPAKLVKYLNYLDKNDTAYKEYFRWRTMKVESLPQYNRTDRLCQLCRIIHGINVDNIYYSGKNEFYSEIPMFGYPNKSRVVSSLRKYFYEEENRKCLPSY